MEIISVIVPTRKRPTLFYDFTQSLFKNAKYPEKIEVIALIDDDDNSYDDIKNSYPGVDWVTSRRCGIGHLTTKGIDLAAGEIVFLCNDDVLALTENWDERFREVHCKYEDGVYLAGPNDLNKGTSLFVFPVFSRATFLALDKFTKHYSGAYIDTHIHEIFDSLKFRGHNRIEYLEDIVFQHKHFSVTGEDPDTVYRDRSKFVDDKKFFLLAANRDFCAEKLLSRLEPIKSELEQKKVTQFGLIRSCKIYMSGKYLPRLRGLKIIFYFVARAVLKLLATHIIRRFH